MEQTDTKGVSELTKRPEGVVLPRNPRVLIVEDSKDVAEYLRRVLEVVDAEVEPTSFTSGEAAVKMLDDKDPSSPGFDFLITDMGLTDGQNAGVRVVERFRAKYPQASINVLTGDPQRVDELYTPEQRKQLNFEVWAKPIEMKQIIDKAQAVKRSINEVPQNPQQ